MYLFKLRAAHWRHPRVVCHSGNYRAGTGIHSFAFDSPPDCRRNSVPQAFVNLIIRCAAVAELRQQERLRGDDASVLLGALKGTFLLLARKIINKKPYSGQSF